MSKVKICQIRRDNSNILIHRRFFTPKSAIVRREGTRSPDNMEFTSDIVADIKENDEIYYIQDVTDVENLVGMFNFYGNFRDESGYEHDDVRSNPVDLPEAVDLSNASNIYERLNLDDSYVSSIRRKYLGFYKMTINARNVDGIKMYKRFVESNSANAPIINMSGNFEVWIELASSNSFPAQMETLIDFYDELTSKGLLVQWDGVNNQIKITANNGGVANISVASLTLDSDLHMLRLKRLDGVFTLYSDNTLLSLSNSSYNGDLNHSNLYWYIGKKYDESTSSWSEGFNGNFFQLRFYNDILTDEQAFEIWSARAQQLTMKFGGTVWKIEDGVTKRCQCKGWSAKILSKIISSSTLTTSPRFPEVIRTGAKYTDGKGYEILKDVMDNIGEDEFAFPTNEPDNDPVQYTFGGVNASGKVLDLLEFFMIMASSSSVKYFFNVLPRKTIILDKTIDANLACNEQTSRVIDSFYDDTKTVNMIEVSAHNDVRSDSYSVNVALTSNVLTTPERPILAYNFDRTNQSDIIVENINTATINGVNALVYQYNETIPNGTYGIRLNKNRDKFQVQAPLTGTYTVKIWFSFRYYVLGAFSTIQVISDNTSINEHGVYSRRITVPQIEDGVNLNTFAGKYLVLYNDINQRVKVVFNGLINAVTIGQKLPVSYVTKKLYTSYIDGVVTPLRLQVSSIEYRYPEAQTIIELGENEFNTFDIEKITVDSLRGLDSSVSR